MSDQATKIELSDGDRLRSPRLWLKILANGSSGMDSEHLTDLLRAFARRAIIAEEELKDVQPVLGRYRDLFDALGKLLGPLPRHVGQDLGQVVIDRVAWLKSFAPAKQPDRAEYKVAMQAGDNPPPPNLPDPPSTSRAGSGKAGVTSGLSKEASIATNERGGKQSATPYRCDLLPPLAILAVSQVLEAGARKYGEDNWRNISPAEHVNHALAHLFGWLAGDDQDDHLEHAACRLLMALDTDLGEECDCVEVCEDCEGEAA